MQRFEQLDALRYVFAAMVVLGHAAGWGRTVPAGGHAVDFFFVLSGFVLQHLIEHRPMDWRDFAVRRFILRRSARYLATFGAVAAVFIVAQNGKLPNFDVGATAAFLLNATLLQSAGFMERLSYNWPAWSISTEMIVNLSVFFVFATRRWYAAAFFAALIVYVVLFAEFGAFDHRHAERLGYLNVGLMRTVAGVMMGVAAYGAFRFVDELAPNGRITTIAFTVTEAAALVLVADLLRPKGAGDKLALVLFMPVLIVLFAMTRGWIARMAAARPLAYLGSLSYGVYLLHGPILIIALNLNLLDRPDSETPPDFIEALAVLAITTLVAAPVFHFFERPAKCLITEYAERTKAFAKPD